MLFDSLGLSEPVLRSVKEMGFTVPTPIQEKVIPMMLAGQDIIGSAQTGTGKTAAFALPIISQLDGHKRAPRALILEPTRELTAQVEEAVRTYSQFTDLRTGSIYGGISYGPQNQLIQKGVDILVATPGRLLDHLQRRTFRLDALEFLVIDEADRMLDMGFLPDVRKIVQQCPKKRHTALFSATIPPELDSLSKWALHEAETVAIGHQAPPQTVTHVLYPVADSQKIDLLKALLGHFDYHSAIVFCRTRDRADRIGVVLGKGHAVAVMHSDRSQKEREAAIQGFRSGKFEVLVATDLAARGLDITHVTHVINFDIPENPEDYVHRIGRTGRAAKVGDAFTLVTAMDMPHVEAIERFINRKIDRAKLEGFDYTYTTALQEQKGPLVKTRGQRVRGGYYCGPSRRR